MKTRVSWIRAAAAVLGITSVMYAGPVHAQTTYTAKADTTFYSLSKQYGIGLDRLLAANPSVRPTNVYPGLKLTIPGENTVKPAAKQTASAESGTAGPRLTVQPETKQVEAWGKVFTYDKTIKVKASAYSSAASENGKWGAVDYFGNPLRLGTIAVDPSVIPMGTKVLVTGHAHPGLPKEAFLATASDQGSAIKGSRIDIFIPGSQSFVREFGYQEVELFVINS